MRDLPQQMAMQQLKGSSKQMGDLVERLRHEGVDAFQQKYSLGMFKLCGEAADRIEALEAVLAQIAELTNASKNTTCNTCRKAEAIARAALAPEQDK